MRRRDPKTHKSEDDPGDFFESLLTASKSSIVFEASGAVNQTSTIIKFKQVKFVQIWTVLYIEPIFDASQSK